MENPSSTSSSEQAMAVHPRAPGGPPWVAILACAIALVIDASLFSGPLVWKNIEVEESLYNLLELGVLRDRLELLEFDEAATNEAKRSNRVPAQGLQPSNDAGVFLIGSSRLQFGFMPNRLPNLGISREQLVKLAHPQLLPFEMRAAAETVASYQPTVVVLVLGELETHSSVQLIPGSSFGNVDAIWDLVNEAGAAFAFEHRALLMRIAAMGWLDTYHYRQVLDKAGLGVAFKFPGRPGLDRRSNSINPAPLASGRLHPIPQNDLDEIARAFDARFPGRGGLLRKTQFHEVRSISTGMHARINLRLVERTVEILQDAGAQVILIEAPIFPDARKLYDPATREEFVAFANRLAMHERVSFVPLDDAHAFGAHEFSDLTHLLPEGALVFGHIISDAIERGLEAGSRP